MLSTIECVDHESFHRLENCEFCCFDPVLDVSCRPAVWEIPRLGEKR